MAEGGDQARLDAIAPELPYELQSKLLDQLATMGVAGAGLVITLRGSVLQHASNLVWMAAVEFGLAALVALVAQINLIEGLFARSLAGGRVRIMVLVAVVLIGMGVGTLGTSVILEGDRPAAVTDKTGTASAGAVTRP